MHLKYKAVPAGAFSRNDPERFSKYIEGAACGGEDIHCETLFPYEIIRPFMDERRGVK